MNETTSAVSEPKPRRAIIGLVAAGALAVVAAAGAWLVRPPDPVIVGGGAAVGTLVARWALVEARRSGRPALIVAAAALLGFLTVALFVVVGTVTLVVLR